MVDHIESPLAFVLLGIGTPLLGAALTVLLVRRRGTPVEPDQGLLLAPPGGAGRTAVSAPPDAG
jgi:hypothetical protein